MFPFNMRKLNKNNKNGLTEKKILLVSNTRHSPRHPGEVEVSHDQDLPAVHDYCPCVLGIARLHLLQELQHPDGGEGDPKVGPAGEVELSHQALRFLVRDVADLKGKRAVWLMINAQISLLSSPPQKRGKRGSYSLKIGLATSRKMRSYWRKSSAGLRGW